MGLFPRRYPSYNLVVFSQLLSDRKETSDCHQYQMIGRFYKNVSIKSKCNRNQKRTHDFTVRGQHANHRTISLPMYSKKICFRPCSTAPNRGSTRSAARLTPIWWRRRTSRTRRRSAGSVATFKWSRWWPRRAVSPTEKRLRSGEAENYARGSGHEASFKTYGPIPASLHQFYFVLFYHNSITIWSPLMVFS